jgi:hypothetical protein
MFPLRVSFDLAAIWRALISRSSIVSLPFVGRLAHNGFALEADASNRVWFSKEARWLTPSGLVSMLRIIRDRSRTSQGLIQWLTVPDRSRIVFGMTNKRKNPAAVALGRKGGLKGGPARAAKMTAEERKESARNAVTARWAKFKSREKEAGT